MEAQVKLEKELRREEDEMFKVFQMERENEKRKLTDEIKKEWEVKLKELTDMYERNLSKKKKKTPEEERKVCLGHALTLNAPITTSVVYFSHLLKCLRSLYAGKQYGPRSDCSYRSSLFWVHVVCFYTSFASNARQVFAADDFSRRHFQMHYFLAV